MTFGPSLYLTSIFECVGHIEKEIKHPKRKSISCVGGFNTKNTTLASKKRISNSKLKDPMPFIIKILIICMFTMFFSNDL